MNETSAVIEISDDEVRLLVGSVVEGQPTIIYATSRPTMGSVSRGNIIDASKLSDILASLKVIIDKEARIKLNVSEATIVLPNLGFEVFQCEKNTITVGANNEVETVDIQNVMSMVYKEVVPSGSAIIEIVPDFFVLDGGRKVSNPPLGQKSKSLIVSAKVHTLPSRIVSEYTHVVESAGIRAKRLVAAPYANAEIIKRYAIYPKDYLLVELGDQITAFNLIGNNSVYCSTFIPMGQNDLSKLILSDLYVPLEKAYQLQELYGVENRDLSFFPPIASKRHENGAVQSYTSIDLKACIESFMSAYLEKFDSAFDTLLKGYDERVKKLPIVFSGTFLKLFGLEKVLSEKYMDNESVHFFYPKTSGVREAKWVTCLGALLIGSLYRGSLSDQRAKVAQVERMKDTNR